MTSPDLPAIFNLGQKYVLKARTGVAVPLRKGQSITIINTPGTQVVDAWAVSMEDATHHMSMAATHALTLHLSPRVGDVLVTNRCVPILQIIEDTSPRIHDTLIAACSLDRYHLLGVPPDQYHANCSDNFHSALAALSLPSTTIPSKFPTPAPLNLFMNIPVRQSGPTPHIGEAELSWEICPCKPGDLITLRSLLPCVVVLSACPNDIAKINSYEPKDVEFVVQRDET